MWCTWETNVSHLDENVAALWVWLNSSKSDDLRTNAFSTSKKFESRKFFFFLFAGHHCCESRCYKSRCEDKYIFYPYFRVKSLCFDKRLIYSQVNAVGNFSNILIEILFTDSWRQPFTKLPIPKLSLHNSAAFLHSAKALQRFAWKSNFLTYTLALGLPDHLTFFQGHFFNEVRSVAWRGLVMSRTTPWLCIP